LIVEKLKIKLVFGWLKTESKIIIFRILITRISGSDSWATFLETLFQFFYPDI
jgi:hypothetical protein